MLCLREIKDLGREKEGNQEGRLLFYQDADYFFLLFSPVPSSNWA